MPEVFALLINAPPSEWPYRLGSLLYFCLVFSIKLFVDSFVAFSYAPIRFVSIMGIAMFVLGMIWSAYLISRKLIYNDLESGWPALVSIIMIGFGITNISLGIIAEYLWRALDASRKRPAFIINEIIELK